MRPPGASALRDVLDLLRSPPLLDLSGDRHHPEVDFAVGFLPKAVEKILDERAQAGLSVGAVRQR
jgi:hypothetical protein